MLKLTYLLVLVPALLFADTSVMAQEKTKGASTFKGYLVDKMCGMGIIKSGDAKKATERAMKHTKSCALEEGCKASGYGLVMGRMFHKFDVAGDKKAEEYFTKTKKKDDFLVEVEGTADGNMIRVASIRDVGSAKK